MDQLLFEGAAEIIGRSLYISLLGVLLAAILALPFSYIVARFEFFGKTALVLLMQSLMALPPVVVGLVLYLLFVPDAIFGQLGWLYHVNIMVLAQLLLAFPIVFSLSYDAFSTAYRKFKIVLRAFPKAEMLSALMLFREVRLLILTALIAAFARTIAEVGAVLIVGGNIEGLTQVMTTVIVQETGKGNLNEAVILGVILFLIAIIITAMSFALRNYWRRGGKDD